MKTLKTGSIIVMLAFFASVLHAQTVETRSLGSFTKLKTSGSWNVVLQKGDTEEVRLEAKNLDLNKVITEVKNNTLAIYLEKGSYRNMGLTVFVTFKELESINSSGSGNLKSSHQIQAEDLEVILSGSGDAEFKDIVADNLTVTMSGSGNVSVDGGAVGRLSVKQSGSGNFKGLNLQSEEADIHKSGSGNTALTANKSLSVRSSGSGNVNYQGNPTYNDVRFSGSGRVVKNN